MIQHYYSYKELEYDQDHLITSSLDISINDEDFGKYNHPKNSNNDSFLDGKINTDFSGNSIVTMTCDDECVCTLEKTQPTCQIQAAIYFPSVEDAYYGM